jgi:uncharacterized DUF497 family protein
VVDWRRFAPSDFEYDFERDELAQHGVTFDEAVECFFLTFRFAETRNTVIVISCSAGLLAAGS